MPRVTTAFAAALALFMPIGRPLLVGLTPAVGIGAGLLTAQEAYAQNKNAKDLYNSGIDKAESGNLEGAIADWTKAIEIYPRFTYAYYNRGFVKHELQDYQGAIDDYTKAIELNPELYQPYTNRGITLELIGNLKDACRDWKKAVDLGDTKPIEWVRKHC